MTRETGRWRARSPSWRSGGSVRSAKRWPGDSKRACPGAAGSAGMDAGRHRGANPVSRCPRPCRGGPCGARRRALTPQARHSRRWSMGCCGQYRAIARRRRGTGPLVVDTPLWLVERGGRHYGEARRRASPVPTGRATLDLSVGDAAGWAERLGGAYCQRGPCASTHTPVAELAGYGEGDWWVQDAAGALPARLFGGSTRQARGRSLRRAGRKNRANWRRNRRRSLGSGSLGRTAEAARRTSNACAFAPKRSRRRAGLHAAPFDAILLDAPCSATGTIRRHPDVAWIKRAGRRGPLAKLQAEDAEPGARSCRSPAAASSIACARWSLRRAKHQIAPLLRRNPDVPRATDSGGTKSAALSESVTPVWRSAHPAVPPVGGDNPRAFWP